MLDIFRTDAFSVVSLTDAILKRPYKPGRIGKLGLFRERGITTTTAIVELKDGRLALIPTSPRGGPAHTIGSGRRQARPFLVPHFEVESTIMADEVQGLRAFGSETAVEAVQAVVDERMDTLRAMHEVTLEYMRIGAIKGLILDADGSLIFNLFTEFGVEQQTYAIDLTNPNANVRAASVVIQRMIETELGAEPVTGYRGFAGDDFFDQLIQHASVEESVKYQESRVLRTDLRAGFDYGGITWENYRGSVGGVEFFPTDEAYVVPDASGIFATYFAPADFIETVNTLGLPLYAKTVYDQDLNRWVKLHTQSNPLALNLRPRAVVRVTIAT